MEVGGVGEGAGLEVDVAEGDLLFVREAAEHGKHEPLPQPLPAARPRRGACTRATPQSSALHYRTQRGSPGCHRCGAGDCAAGSGHACGGSGVRALRPPEGNLPHYFTPHSLSLGLQGAPSGVCDVVARAPACIRWWGRPMPLRKDLLALLLAGPATNRVTRECGCVRKQQLLHRAQGVSAGRAGGGHGGQAAAAGCSVCTSSM